MSKILVADDSSTQREIIVSILKQNKYNVIIATNGEEALDMIGTSNPDLIILDVIMPGKNGYEVCRDLKTKDATKHIPVILCSTKDTEVDIYWAKKIGANDYLVKPFEPNKLIEMIHSLL